MLDTGNGVYVNYTDADFNFTEDDYNNMINNFTEEDYLRYGYYVTPNGEVIKLQNYLMILLKNLLAQEQKKN